MFKKILKAYLILLITSLSAKAQDDMMMYNMNLIPQSSYVNPAILPHEQIYVGFPVLGNINLGASNSAFKINDFNTNLSSTNAVTNIINSLPANNYVNFKTNIDLFSIGIRTKKMYFYLNATEKVNLEFRYPADFMKFVWLGNGELLGQNLKFDFGLNATHYRSYGFLVSRQINSKLIVGLRLNYLYGMENISTRRSDISLLTDENNFALTAKSNVEINTSGLSIIGPDQLKSTAYHFGKKNTGYGFDAGAQYRLTDKISLTGSLVNFGYINWNSDINNYKSKNPNASFTFDGVNLNKIFNDSIATISNTISSVGDSALSNFAIVENNNSYRTKLSPRIFLGAAFKPTSLVTTSLLFQNYFFEGKMNYAVGVSATASLLEWADLGISYNIYNNSFTNLGVGISLWPGGINFHVVTDNIIGAIKYKETKNLNVRVGFSLVYGKYFLNDDADGDLVPDEKDKCPRQFGKKELDGCPDKDGDMVIDSEDDCPNEFGTKAMNGCPDRDGDRIIDRYDECPDFAGEIQFKGCPDRDHDGVKDSDDKCPTETGTVELKGCPDTDNDGIGDADDLCPTVAGSRNNRGCPVDTDGDGVSDIDDKCPDVFGEKNNSGCPDIDTDGDGLKDKDDSCPLTAGEITNKGCPTLSETDKLLVLDAQTNTKFKDKDSEITPTSYSVLEALANWLNTNKAYLIIQSHTSNQESESFSLALSKERALAVKKFLVAKNVNPTRISTEFFGSTKPVADNNSPEGAIKNNRIEFVVEYK